ncbi:MAG: AmmeMemoRadiSam system radical SAM enzyme [Anaerolineaceae bacterium 4572_32.2]|nr:MAG: AmmeMemoRadiSam system radical SAM enzyme [Anaerolineaceae bacterium 4572_32.2]
MHKEAYLVKSLSAGNVQCQTCEHFCVVKPGETGKCGVHRNLDGTLYLVVYGEAIAVHVDPIEKKPLFHFMPGSDALSIGTYGCNFRCPFCQNWQMSQTRDFDDQLDYLGQQAMPKALVNTCLQNHIPIIAYTYNEPTVFFEYNYDTAKLAHEHGIKNVYVSNGYMSRAALDMIEPYLDGINVDLKAFTDKFYREHCQARLEPVKRNIAHIARESDIWIEITTLLIPGLNDSEDELRAMAAWLASVDPGLVWHVTAFHPDYEMRDRPRTSQRALAQAYEIGKEAGLRYVYVGNVMDTDRESTYCPACGEKLIQRHWHNVKELWRERGVCHRCGQAVAGIWK